ncbi:MAG: hypothetical protein LBC76_01960 [Treponema sp.]|nr:hypothetical protein [Treponema sp.]
MKKDTYPLNVIDDMNISYELGMKYTWINPDNANQKGWNLDKETRLEIANGKFDTLVLALDDKKVKALGGLGGIEIIFNSQENGFCLDYKSFPWYWDKETRIGGYTSYNDLLSERFTFLNLGIIYLKYDITSHPNYTGFTKDMFSGIWGQVSIQYGIGIKDLPLVNAYLMGE